MRQEISILSHFEWISLISSSVPLTPFSSDFLFVVIPALNFKPIFTDRSACFQVEVVLILDYFKNIYFILLSLILPEGFLRPHYESLSFSLQMRHSFRHWLRAGVSS